MLSHCQLCQASLIGERGLNGHKTAKIFDVFREFIFDCSHQHTNDFYLTVVVLNFIQIISFSLQIMMLVKKKSEADPLINVTCSRTGMIFFVIFTLHLCAIGVEMYLTASARQERAIREEKNNNLRKVREHFHWIYIIKRYDIYFSS